MNESTKQSELVVMEDPNNPGGNTGKQVQRKRGKEETGKFKSSLISEQDDDDASMQAEQEDTVYSYLEEETEDFERELMYLHKKQKSINQGPRKVGGGGVAQSLL